MNRFVFRFISTVFGGVVTALGGVGFIPSQAVACPQAFAERSTQVRAESIVDIAAANSSFSTLVSALQAADLVETLSEPGSFTVFAPTNEAFEAIPPETLNQLLEPENRETLRRILTYHVVPDSLLSNNLRSGQLGTVEGSAVRVKVSRNGGVQVDNANVVSADVRASNGVIHIIDQVILPPNISL